MREKLSKIAKENLLHDLGPIINETYRNQSITKAYQINPDELLSVDDQEKQPLRKKLQTPGTYKIQPVAVD